MNYSKKIDLKEFFDSFKEQRYAIIKMNKDIPNYYSGTDIDFFCYSIREFSKCILAVGNKYVQNGFEIRVNELAPNKYVQIDFYCEGKLELKFDLYQVLPEYTRILIKEGFFSSVIENAVIKEKETERGTVFLSVPQLVDDLILRYVEYVEYYSVRADKLKHVEHIEKVLPEDKRKYFFDKLHFYTALPPVCCDMKKINDEFSGGIFKALTREYRKGFRQFIKFRPILRPIESYIRKYRKK